MKKNDLIVGWLYLFAFKTTKGVRKLCCRYVGDGKIDKEGKTIKMPSLPVLEIGFSA